MDVRDRNKTLKQISQDSELIFKHVLTTDMNQLNLHKPELKSFSQSLTDKLAPAYLYEDNHIPTKHSFYIRSYVSVSVSSPSYHFNIN